MILYRGNATILDEELKSDLIKDIERLKSFLNKRIDHFSWRVKNKDFKIKNSEVNPYELKFKDLEREYIRYNLIKYKGSFSKVAEATGLSRAGLYRKCHFNGIRPAIDDTFYKKQKERCDINNRTLKDLRRQKFFDKL